MRERESSGELVQSKKNPQQESDAEVGKKSGPESRRRKEREGGGWGGTTTGSDGVYSK